MSKTTTAFRNSQALDHRSRQGSVDSKNNFNQSLRGASEESKGAIGRRKDRLMSFGKHTINSINEEDEHFPTFNSTHGTPMQHRPSVVKRKTDGATPLGKASIAKKTAVDGTKISKGQQEKSDIKKNLNRR